MISSYSSNPTITLIFVNFRSARYLEKALQSLYQNEEAESFEVVVINNDPDEKELLEYLKRTYKFLLRENSENRGFATAINQGAEEAKAPLLGFLNPDTLWPQKQLKRIETFFVEHPRSVLGLLLESLEKKEERFGSSVHPISLGRLILNHLPRFFIGERPDVLGVAWVSGGAFFIPKGVFKELEGMDTDYFLYYEDVDLCQRASLKKIGIWVHRKLFVTHLRGKSQSSASLQRERYRASQKLFFEKFRPRWEQKALSLGRHLFF